MLVSGVAQATPDKLRSSYSVMTYHKEGPACGKIPCDPTSSVADCEYPLDPYQLQSSHSVGINSPGVQKMCRIYGAAMRNNMNEKLEKIKNWFKRYPYMIALLYMAFYLKAFEWLEQEYRTEIHYSL